MQKKGFLDFVFVLTRSLGGIEDGAHSTSSKSGEKRRNHCSQPAQKKKNGYALHHRSIIPVVKNYFLGSRRMVVLYISLF
mmetsp:Transcript_7927/g.23384  ORF Transcript_7927/g.23384 Transcript_7927/m.23384 type:complete len:80 (-) Transcript_7927:3201-3440(-)